MNKTKFNDYQKVQEFLNKNDTKEIKEIIKARSKLVKERDMLNEQILECDQEVKNLRKELLSNIEITKDNYIGLAACVDYVEGLYKRIQDWFYTNYKDSGLTNSGDLLRNGGLCIRLFHGRPLNDQLGALDWEDKVDQFEIIERTFGHYGVYELVKPEVLDDVGVWYQKPKLNKDTKWVLTKNTHGSAQAKEEGRKLKVREDWDDVKINVMRACLHSKFTNSRLMTKLLETGSAELIEGNWWGDTFWGVCKGKGHNHLGKLLMEIRNK